MSLSQLIRNLFLLPTEEEIMADVLDQTPADLGQEELALAEGLHAMLVHARASYPGGILPEALETALCDFYVTGWNAGRLYSTLIAEPAILSPPRELLFPAELFP
jgi:hypothetical protein